MSFADWFSKDVDWAEGNAMVFKNFQEKLATTDVHHEVCPSSESLAIW